MDWDSRYVLDTILNLGLSYLAVEGLARATDASPTTRAADPDLASPVTGRLVEVIGQGGEAVEVGAILGWRETAA